MSIELIIFLVMVIVFIGGTFLLKLPIGLSMVLAAIAGSLAGGHGIALRHMVEGTFAFVDTILVIVTAMIFMNVIQASGAFDAISASIIKRFHKVPALMLCLIMLVIMFPGMITGSSTASVIAAGSVMAPVLIMMGVPVVKTASILAMGAILGMIAPPTNIPAMIIGAGVDIPYVGFGIPLSVMAFPPAFAIALFFGYKYVKNINFDEIKDKLDTTAQQKYGFRLYIPLLVVVALIIINSAVPQFPDLGMPVIFLIASVVGCFTGDRFNPMRVSKNAVESVMPVLGILVGVGMFIQIMTLTGVRGFLVTTALSMPDWGRQVAMGVSIPLFGAISAYGSASVLGVPFLLSFLGNNQIVVTAALTVIVSVADLMPPTALGGIFAAQVTGMKSYAPILKKCIVPCLIIILWGLCFIMFANELAPYIVHL